MSVLEISLALVAGSCGVLLLRHRLLSRRCAHWISLEIVDFIVFLLPQSEQVRYRKEWTAEVAAIPSSLSKLSFSFGLFLGVRSIHCVADSTSVWRQRLAATTLIVGVALIGILCLSATLAGVLGFPPSVIVPLITCAILGWITIRCFYIVFIEADALDGGGDGVPPRTVPPTSRDF